MEKRKIVLCGSLGFLFGVLAAGSGWSFYSGFLLGIIILFVFRIFKRESLRSRGVGVEILTLCLLFLGFFYYHFYLNFQDKSQNIVFNGQINFSGVVINSPVVKENYQKLNLNLSSPYHGKITILAKTSPILEYGDFLKVNGIVGKSDSEVGLPISFFPKFEVEAKHQGFWLKERLVGLKNRLTGEFKKYFSSDQSALLAGITFGERGDFSTDLKNQMALSGVTHIVALSGYNIAILGLVIQRSLTRFLSRKKTFYITIAAIFLFVLMVGGEASVVRAAIMGSLVLLAQHLGRQHDTFYIVILTAMAMVLFDPTIVVWNVGFQLSFLSLLGIVYIEPVLRRLFKFESRAKESFLSWKENGLTTISAQLAVIPILVLNFNQFSPTSIFANVLILFTVPFTMFLGFLLAGLSSIVSVLGFLVAKLTSILLFYQIAVIKLFSFISLPMGNMLNSKIIFVIYYCGLLAAVYYWDKKLA